jgi:hypothetical protein
MSSGAAPNGQRTPQAGKKSQSRQKHCHEAVTLKQVFDFQGFLIAQILSNPAEEHKNRGVRGCALGLPTKLSTAVVDLSQIGELTQHPTQVLLAARACTP